jgi:hypothetical protein
MDEDDYSPYRRVFRAWVRGEGVALWSSELLEECVSIAYMRLDTPAFSGDAPQLRLFASNCERELERRAIMFLRAPGEDESLDEYLAAHAATA